MTTESGFWDEAARMGLPQFRFLRRSLTIELLDSELLGTRLESEWCALKARMLPDDQIWPFEFHVRANLGLRRGYVVLRQGHPIGGVVTEVS